LACLCLNNTKLSPSVLRALARTDALAGVRELRLQGHGLRASAPVLAKLRERYGPRVVL
jgi:hypothetical protein